MFNIIDFIGIIIVLISAIIAFKKGFVKTFFSFVSTFVALILAFVLCNTGVSIIKNSTKIDEWLTETITASLSANHENIEEQENQSENHNIFSQTLEDLPQNLQDVVGLEEYKENAKTALVENSVEIIIKVLSWIIIYILVRVALMIACIVFDEIMSLPFLKQINNLAGLAVGFVLGLFRIYFILAIISFISSVVSMDGFIALIKNSMILSAMYENNILLSLIF